MSAERRWKSFAQEQDEKAEFYLDQAKACFEKGSVEAAIRCLTCVEHENSMHRKQVAQLLKRYRSEHHNNLLADYLGQASAQTNADASPELLDCLRKASQLIHADRQKLKEVNVRLSRLLVAKADRHMTNSEPGLACESLDDAIALKVAPDLAALEQRFADLRTHVYPEQTAEAKSLLASMRTAIRDRNIEGLSPLFQQMDALRYADTNITAYAALLKRTSSRIAPLNLYGKGLWNLFTEPDFKGKFPWASHVSTEPLISFRLPVYFGGYWRGASSAEDYCRRFRLPSSAVVDSHTKAETIIDFSGHTTESPYRVRSRTVEIGPGARRVGEWKTGDVQIEKTGWVTMTLIDARDPGRRCSQTLEDVGDAAGDLIGRLIPVEQ